MQYLEKLICHQLNQNSFSLQIQRFSQDFYINKKMSKLIILAFALLIVGSVADNSNPQVPTPVTVGAGQEITFNAVFPKVDQYLRQTYWYYLRAANIVYQANVNTKASFLFFVIYRNLVGTFLVITTWDKAGQTTQVNTFVRLGNGYAAGSGALYDPVKINPFVISLQLGEGQYMVTINEDGTITVVGDAPSEGGNNTPQVNVQTDMDEKCGFVDTFIRNKYWYFLNKAQTLYNGGTPTSQRYYCTFVYVNIVGTFLVLGNWDLTGKASGINTFVRLGNGYELGSGANYDQVAVTSPPVTLSPAVMEMKDFGQ